MTDKYIDYLNSLASRGSKPGLERILKALQDLGNPQDRLRVINVTGTNGKGSYCKMLGGILAHSDYTVGIFSSPHLERINECISINSNQITDTELSHIIKKVMPVLEKNELTQFEALTVIAIVFFVEQNVQAAIMEVGMGGALDATNVFKKNVMSVILDISLDHTSYLGSTLKEIAKEKSGIIKKGCPVFLACNKPEVIEVVNDQAALLEAPVYRSKDCAKIIISHDSYTIFSYLGENYTLNSGADYQVENAQRVLSTVDALKEIGYSISQDAPGKAFCEFFNPARFEIISTDPYILFDGAHNPHGVDALVRNFKNHFEGKKFDLIMGVMADKDVDSLCQALSSISARVYTVTPPNPRAMSSHDLMKKFESLGIEAFDCESFDEALRAWSRKNPLLCAGSLYSYGEFKKSLRNFKLI